MSSIYPLNLFPEQEVEQDIDSLDGQAFLEASARQVLKYLWQNWQENTWPSSIFDRAFFEKLKQKHHSLPTFFRALLKDRDPYLLKATRLEIQQVFNRLFDNITQNSPANEAQQLKLSMAIHNMLSIYVMFSPTPYESLKIPQYSEHGWQQVEFSIEPIELSPKQGWWVNFLGDNDRLFSYGFSPTKEHPKANSILMHCGTGWPTAQGSAIQVLADIWPDKTPGEVFFEWQADEINQWLDKQNNTVITAGQSLGGSLAYLTAMHRPDKISDAYCLVPPGLSQDYDKNHPLFGAWERTEQAKRPNVIIQKQHNDPVSKCGIFKTDFKLLKTQLEQEQKFNPIIRLVAAHARNFSSCDKATMEFADMAQENESQARQTNNYYLYNKARPVAFYGLLMPYFLFIKPARAFIEKHALTCALTLMLMLSCVLSPAFASVILALPGIATISSPLLAITIASYALGYATNSLLSIGNLPRYFRRLASLPITQASMSLLIDTLNQLSLGGLIGMARVLSFAYTLPNFFSARQSTTASIHTEAHFLGTQDLSTHPKPTIYDKLQVAALVILFYGIALPIKLVFFDLPAFISAKCTKQPEAQENTSESEAEATYVIDIEPEDNNNEPSKKLSSDYGQQTRWQPNIFAQSTAAESKDSLVEPNHDEQPGTPVL